jgi:hypothetical protein
MTRGRRPESAYQRWAKGRGRASRPLPPFVGTGGACAPIPDRHHLTMMGDENCPLFHLDKPRWVYVLGEVRKVEARRKRRLPWLQYVELVGSLLTQLDQDERRRRRR